LSTFPDGVFQYGGQPIGSHFSHPWATAWFVDAATGSDAFDGKKPTSAKATIDAAVQLMGVGDVLYIRPQAYVVGTGHQRYSECATIDLAQSDLSIIGVGYPRNNEFGVRMKCDGTSLYCFDVSGPSCHFENIGLFSSSGTYTLYARNNGVTATQRGSDGITLYNVNSKGSPLFIQGGQAARVINCVFNNAAYELILSDGTVTGVNQQVRGCAFLDTAQATAVTHPHVSAGGQAELWIDECFFGRIPTSTAYYILLTGANSSGMATRCFFNTTNLDTDTDISIDSSAFAVVGCYDTTGLVDSTND
jgi:hypothetical protein